ncbi:MAG: AAA family ATPase [Candidatus Marinimicrobia bacterium]|jgi:MoxR-like ATPase|nr:AAA family ATPase [Candidatus Neomarinimicrobiota bacterium]MBT3574920.1 AAA family ATPase [Candidatus Neomarinimicrobiota bacterium]MBT3679697.1 AAA family ATPase [Candidatus Neomarinimicrobiota bacterium]MBT3950800.1 AAA family ATPase [Candidatus Neomarinimicrobiota bacterium]MBT4252391.1 AAA family ATPase [Candidatus Neomarinimicrobiota bacterium]
MTFDLTQLNEKIKEKSLFLKTLEAEAAKVVVGQQGMIRRILIGLLSNGHILLEGVPGLAKTLTIKTLAQLIDTSFNRIQFTPDLLPADLLGTLIYNQKNGEFNVKKGPLFGNIILADEINRSPAKVQAALLESMQEKQITIGDSTYKLEEPFLVLATQNPIEQEGTYPLPEAQVDRFMLKLKVDYPTDDEEFEIIKRMAHPEPKFDIKPVIKKADILEARNVVDEIYIDDKIFKYIVSLVTTTRDPAKSGLVDLEALIEYGASPRASINLALAAKANAFINQRGYVTPDDIRAIGMDVLRHRVLVSYEAEAEEVTSEDIVQRIFEVTEVP